MRGLPSDLPDAWLEIAEYTLDASRVVLVSERELYIKVTVFWRIVDFVGVSGGFGGGCRTLR